jgi:hypothetical protein
MGQGGQRRSDPRRDHLDALETRVSDLVDEACKVRVSSDGTTGEYIRLEETLSFAAEAAKQVVSLRRKLRTEDDVGGAAAVSALPPA